MENANTRRHPNLGGKSPSVAKLPGKRLSSAQRATQAAQRRKRKPGVHTERFKLELCQTAFARLVREIALEVGGPGAQGLRYSRAAMLALQEAAEAHLIVTFEMVQNLATHANRITIQQKDMVLLQTLRRRLDPGYGGRN